MPVAAAVAHARLAVGEVSLGGERVGGKEVEGLPARAVCSENAERAGHKPCAGGLGGIESAAQPRQARPPPL